MSEKRSLQPLPMPGSPEYKLLRRAYRLGNDLQATSFSLDALFARLQRSKQPVSRQQIVEETSFAREALEQAEQQGNGSGSWNDYFRLASRLDFAEPIVRLGSFFEGDVDFRRDFVNGMAGIGIGIIEKALQHFDNPNLPDQERMQLLGSINEPTYMSLMNHANVPNRIVLPASTYDDVTQKTDANLYYIENKTHQKQTANVQVKSSQKRSDENHVPENGVLIAATEFGNNLTVPISRLLVEQMNNGLDSKREQKIKKLSEKVAGLTFDRINNTKDKPSGLVA